MSHVTRTAAPDFTLVVPTYNEREQVPRLIEEIFAVCSAHQLSPEVIVVDDNSPDGTGARAEELADRWPVRVLHRRAKLGLGSAVMAGVDASTTSIVGVMDADLSHPPRLVPALFNALKSLKADMVVASRYVPGGRTEQWPWIRHAMSRVACWAARPLTPVRDPMSGFFLMRKDLVSGLRTSTQGFKIGLELLVRTRPQSVAEIAYTFQNRTGGRSKMNAGEVFRYLRQLISLLSFSARHRPPRPHYRILRAPQPAEANRAVEPHPDLSPNVAPIAR
jgi:dolichol-phosphate mannosyltransferase